MRIALLGNFGIGNFGNDASLEAMLNILRSKVPAVELTCICPRPDVVRGRYGIATMGIVLGKEQSRIGRVVERVSFGASHQFGNLLIPFWRCRGFDVVMVPGTGILDDYRDRPMRWPLILLRWCLAARLHGARVAFVGIGAGPILNPTSRCLMKWAARLCQFRSYRDTASREFVRSLGIDVSGDQVIPDLALGLPVSPSQPPACVGYRATVGLGIMTYHGWVAGSRDGDIYASYLQRLTSLTLALDAKGYRVRILMGDVSDEAVGADLVRSVESCVPATASEWLVLQHVTDIHDVLHQIESCDVVVAVRYHNVIAALLKQRPVVSLEYAAKNSVLLRAFGLGEFCHHIEHFEVEAVIADVERLLSTSEGHVRSVGEHLSEARAVLARHAETLALQVLRLPPSVALTSRSGEVRFEPRTSLAGQDQD